MHQKHILTVTSNNRDLQRSKIPHVVLATTMSVVMIISNPSIANTNNGTPVRPYGISGGQGTDHLAIVTPSPVIELESTKPIKAPKRKVQVQKKNTHPSTQHTKESSDSRYEVLLQKSKIASSSSEVLFFGHYFGVNPKDPEAFIKKVKDIQKQAGFSKKDQDGIIGPGTLKILYTKYYNTAKSLPKDIQARQNLIQIANRYQKKGHRINPYNKGAYLGLSGTMNIPNTYLDSHLYSHLPGERNASQYQLPVGKKHTPNSVLVRKIKQENKYVLAFYDSRGRLAVLSYTSPGKNGKRWDKKSQTTKSTQTTRGKFTTSESPIPTYVSNAFEVPMPNAVFYNWKVGEAIHGSNKVSGKLASSGCLRLPLFYTDGISQYVKGQKITVDTRGVTYKK